MYIKMSSSVTHRDMASWSRGQWCEKEWSCIRQPLGPLQLRISGWSTARSERVDAWVAAWNPRGIHDKEFLIYSSPMEALLYMSSLLDMSLVIMDECLRHSHKIAMEQILCWTSAIIPLLLSSSFVRCTTKIACKNLTINHSTRCRSL